MGVSLKNPEITETGTVCEVQQNGENYTTFVVCSTRGWSSTRNEGLFVCTFSFCFRVKSTFEIVGLPNKNSLMICFLVAFKFKTKKTEISIPDRNVLLG